MLESELFFNLKYRKINIGRHLLHFLFRTEQWTVSLSSVNHKNTEQEELDLHIQAFVIDCSTHLELQLRNLIKFIKLPNIGSYLYMGPIRRGGWYKIDTETFVDNFSPQMLESGVLNIHATLGSTWEVVEQEYL